MAAPFFTGDTLNLFISLATIASFFAFGMDNDPPVKVHCRAGHQ
jgi:rhodanese-related sulfurtransferase